MGQREGFGGGGRGKNQIGGKGGRGGARGGGVEQHRYGVGIKVRDGQIELAIKVHIAHRDGYRGGARGEVLLGGKAGRGGAWGGGVEQHRYGVGINVRDGQIELDIKGHNSHRGGIPGGVLGLVQFGGKAGGGGARGGGVEQHRHGVGIIVRDGLFF